jgi:hypothetical protein
MFRFLFTIVFILLSLINSGYSEEIPIIVISAGKASQSKGVVGSDLEILDSKILKEGNIVQLGEAIADNISGANYSSQGGGGDKFNNSTKGSS